MFPGGGIEEGETPEEATKREVYEELGVHIKVEHLIAKVKYKGNEYYYVCLYYRQSVRKWNS